MEKRYFFAKAETLASYLMTKYHWMSPVRMNKSLFILYAYYGALRSHRYPGKYPEELFPATFLAWFQGPVLEGIYPDEKLREIYPHKLTKDKYDEDIIRFLDNIIDQLNEISDFGLVSLVEIEPWKNVYARDKKAEEMVMNKKAIIDYYIDILKDEE